jgi:ABC-type dipeptide/oligopeptide/nickel transport system permease subunit
MIEADLTVWSGLETSSAATISHGVGAVLGAPSPPFDTGIDRVAMVVWSHHILFPDIFAFVVGCVIDNVMHLL